MKTIKRTALISWFLAILITVEMLPLDLFRPLQNLAQAAGETSWTIEYPSPATASPALKGVLYNQQEVDSNTHTFTAGTGKLIGSIIAKTPSGDVDVTPVDAKNQSTWTGQLHFKASGAKDKVYLESNQNKSAKGYYAWYRYTPGDPHGTDWYEDKPNVTTHCGINDGGPTEVVNGTPMPKYPNCDDPNLSLSASRENPFVLQSDHATPIPSTLVDPSTRYFHASINVDARNIQGPVGISGGTPYNPSKTFGVSARNDQNDPTNPDSFEVDYGQSFTEDSGYYKDLGLPGAKMMVYFAAFYVDITAATWLFPTTVTINYVDAPSGANLTISEPSATDSCFTSGQSEHLTSTVTNNGTQDVTTPITGKFLADGVQISTFSLSGGLRAGQSASVSVNYTFNSTKTITVVVDQAPGEQNTTDNNAFHAFTPSATCGGGGGPEVITGTLSVDKPSINYGESDTVRLAHVSVSGGDNCRLLTGTLVYTQGSYSKSEKLDLTGDFSENFVPSPYNGFGAGSISVVYKIVTTCGSNKDIGPGSFTVVIPSGLGQPQFEAAWFDNAFYSGYNDPVSMVPIGEVVSLGPITKPAIPATGDTGTPYDPNGAAIIYTWDFAGSSDPWIRNLGDTRNGYGFDPHGEHFSNIRADTKGTHTVQVAAIDTKGAAAGPYNVTLDIVDPNPVPVITMPPGRIVEGRTFPAPTCERSFSPYKNRVIASCIWYGTNVTYQANAGSYLVKLDVTDNTGLMSLSPATATLKVQPDEPPVAKLLNTGTGLRGAQMFFIDQSYSPDSDPISEHTDTLSCDTNNNGSYADEASTVITPDSNGYLYYTPTRIGNCKIHIHIREGLGYKKSDDKDFYFTVENDQPSASFAIKGSYQPPSMSLPTVLTAGELTSSSWKVTSLDGDLLSKYWYETSSGTLKTVPAYGWSTTGGLIDGKSPYNGIDLTKPITQTRYDYPIDPFESGGYTTVTPWFSIGNTCSWNGCWGSSIVKKIDGVQQWSKSDPTIIGSPVMSPDLTKYAYGMSYQVCTDYMSDDGGGLECIRYATHYRIQIGDNSTGSTTKSIECDLCRGVFGTYENYILIKYSGGLSAWDWSGNLIWANSSITTTNSSIVTSKDGYLYMAVVPEVSVQQFTLYVQQFDLKTGAYMGSTPPLAGASGSTEDDSGVNVGSPTLKMLSDGTIETYFYYSYSYGGSATYKAGATFSGTATPQAKKEPYYMYGQFENAAKTTQNGEFTYSFKFDSTTIPGESAGFSFRITDNQNFYRVEHSSDTTSLVSYVNGTRSVISSRFYPISNGTFCAVKIKVSADHIKVYVNGAILIDVYNSALTATGMYGPYDSKTNTEFKGIAVLPYPPTAYLDNVLVAGNPIQYNTNYTDPEHDPLRTDSAKWTFSNQSPYMYLDQGDGFSDVSPYNSYSNQVIASPNASINKVGYFKIDYQVADDPSPAPYTYADGTFSSFSKYTDPYTQYAKVVRVPIAKFTPYLNADNTFGFTDNSYDPDRCYSNLSCQGGYGSNHGIFDHRWKYTAPDGATSYGFPSRPSQSGTYLISEAVMQEDGVWSDWYEQSLSATIPVANHPPVAMLTFPSGSQASPSYVNTLTPSISWNQTDQDPGTTFAAFEAVVKDIGGNIVVDSGIQAQGTPAASAQWTINQALAMGQKYQVQVRVNDGMAWSAWSNVGWLITNRPPYASMTYPNGMYEAPTIAGTLRPTFVWSQGDPDPGTTLSYFQLQVWDEANSALLLDSGQRWQGSTAGSGSWTADADLPVRQKLRVRVRVHDGFTWSDWSPDAWLLVNRTPLADFDWSPKPVWEGDTLRLTNASNDPDGDALAYAWQVTGPNGAVTSYSTKDVTLPSPAAAGTYTVSLTVSDGLAAAFVSKSILTQPLTIAAEVTYTPQWLAYHEQHGHRTTTDPKDFYSGEIFVVRVVSSPTAVAEVSAWIDTTAADGSPLSCSTILTLSGYPHHFAGELYDDAFSSLSAGLPVGPLPIHFRIRYANGVVKVQDVPVNILGPVLQTISVHRVK